MTVGVTPEVLRTRYNIGSVVGHEPNNSQVGQECVASRLNDSIVAGGGAVSRPGCALHWTDMTDSLQYFHQYDLTEFWKGFGSAFTHKEEVFKVMHALNERPITDLLGSMLDLTQVWTAQRRRSTSRCGRRLIVACSQLAVHHEHRRQHQHLVHVMVGAGHAVDCSAGSGARAARCRARSRS